MRKIYCIVQSGSNPSYMRGIIAICTSLSKAIKLVCEKYERDLQWAKPKEYNLTINGVFTHYYFENKEYNAWLKVEILEEQMNKIIR